MKIAVISDTHLREPSPWLERVYEKYMAGADALIHCGDTTGFSVWQFFMQHPNFTAVAGNMDETRLARELPARAGMNAAGFKIGATHGVGFVRARPEMLAESFGPGYDVICYGHTHDRAWTGAGEVRLLNPGSLSEPRYRESGMAFLYLDQETGPRAEFLIFEPGQDQARIIAA